MACWTDPSNRLCYPITDAALNLWSSMHVSVPLHPWLRTDCNVSKIKDPEAYPTNKKLTQLNLYANGPRSRAPAQNVPPEPTHAPQFQGFPPFGSNFYPPQGMPGMAPFYYGQLGPYAPPVANYALPVPPVAAPAARTEYPKITAWLAYCDRHPDRSGENFSAHAQNFDLEGYRRIHQLTGDRISVEKLSAWLGIGKGTADLLIGYAEEDVALIKAGTPVLVTLADEGEDF
jgi:hypothetical protein